MTGDSRTAVGRATERGIRYGLLAVLVVGIRRRDLGAVVNAIGGLLFTALPAVVEWRYDVTLQPWQRVYTSSAALTHAVGMLGPYDDVWWYDHLTHTHTSSIVAGVVYTHARKRGHEPRPRVLAAIAIVGLFWEALEHLVHALARLVNLESILVPYGKRDTLGDLCFNFVGAGLVLLFGDRLLPKGTETESSWC